MGLGRMLDYQHLGNDAWNSFCRNCWKRLDEGSSFWSHWLISNPGREGEDCMEQRYCDECVQVDMTREFHGDPPPATESE